MAALYPSVHLHRTVCRSGTRPPRGGRGCAIDLQPKGKKGVDKDGTPKMKRAPSACDIFVEENCVGIKEVDREMD